MTLSLHYVNLPLKMVGELLGKVLTSQKSVETSKKLETESLDPKKSETKNDKTRLKPNGWERAKLNIELRAWSLLI